MHRVKSPDPPPAQPSADRSALGRRRFLQAAALGVASTALPLAARAEEAQETNGLLPPGLHAFEGVLTSIGAQSLAVDVGGASRTVPVGPASSFWKGTDTDWWALTPGDEVLVRTVNGGLDRAWADLDRMRGLVVGRTGQGYLVSTQRSPEEAPYQQEVRVTDRTSYEDALVGKATGARRLPNGAGVDVIGLRVSQGLVASVVSYAMPGAKPLYRVSPGPDAISRPTAPTATCSATYYGFASWFSCPSGAGRCGTCSTSNDRQTAWPALDACGCCGRCGCDCSRNCKNQAYKHCGNSVSIVSLCNSVSHVCAIVDCGPCQNCSCGCSTCVCSHTCSKCSPSRTTPVVDLTRPTFAAFGYDPSKVGCFNCKATVSVLC